MHTDRLDVKGCFLYFCNYVNIKILFCQSTIGAIFSGIANAIDLADRFLPKLESLNCKHLPNTSKKSVNINCKKEINMSLAL